MRLGLGGRKGLGIHALIRAITVIRGLFKYAYEINLLDKPTRYSKVFERPSATLKRKSRRATELQNGKRLFEPDEVRAMLHEANTPLRAMILLGINGGLGNTDCARLPIAAVSLDKAVLEFDRPKSGIERVVPLWPETVAALRQALAARPKPATDEVKGLVFLTTLGQLWVRENIHRTEDNRIRKVVPMDAITQAFDKVIRRLGLKRKGIGFYTLRHTFRTWADEVRDQHAIHRIMGHAIPGMAGIYVEEISLDRLRAVVNHVRSKLLGSAETAKTAASVPPDAT
jgi:integrase